MCKVGGKQNICRKKAPKGDPHSQFAVRIMKTFTKGKTAGGKDDILNLELLLVKQIMVMFMQKRIEKSKQNLMTKVLSKSVLPLLVQK